MTTNYTFTYITNLSNKQFCICLWSFFARLYSNFESFSSNKTHLANFEMKVITSQQSVMLHGGVVEFMYHQCFVCFDHICGISVNRVVWLSPRTTSLLLSTSEHSSFPARWLLKLRRDSGQTVGKILNDYAKICVLFLMDFLWREICLKL